MRGFFGLVVVLCVRTHPIRRVNVGFDRWGRTSRLLFAQPRLERIPCRSSRAGRAGAPAARGRGIRSPEGSRRLTTSRLHKGILSSTRIDMLVNVTTDNLASMDKSNIIAAYKKLGDIIKGKKSAPDSLDQGSWWKVHNLALKAVESDFLNPFELSSMVANHKGLPNSTVILNALQLSAVRQSSRFLPKNIAHFYIGLIQLRAQPKPELLKIFDKKLRDSMVTCQPHVAASVLWALRKMNVEVSEDLIQMLGEKVAGDVNGTVRVKLLARSVWSFASFKFREGRAKPSDSIMEMPLGQSNNGKQANVLERLVNVMGERVRSDSDIEASDLAHAIWAFAKISYQDSEFTDTIKEKISDRISIFDGYDIANILWSLAKLQCEQPNSELLSLLEGCAIDFSSSFKPQGLSNCLWAFATLSHPPSTEFIEASKHYMQTQGKRFDAQSISNTLWACAKLEIKLSPQEIMSLEEGILKVYKEFVPQEISISLWAFAHLEQKPSSAVLGALEEQLSSKIPLMSAQGVANTLW
ncbi:hypothetical protein AAMO2058_001565300 [Amorphochlora amoebiformis]